MDTASGTIQAPGEISINGTPREVVVTPDSKYAFIISSSSTSAAILTVVDLTTNQRVKEVTQFGVTGGIHLSVSPVGQVYATGQFTMVEFDGRPPFAEHARSGTLSNPGKLTFSADGRYALAANELLNGSSILCIDFQTKDGSPAGKEISRFLISSGTPPATVKIDDIFMINASTAVAYSAALGKLYRVTFPTLAVSELSVGGVVAAFVTSVARTDEFPITRNLYYTAGGKLVRTDLVNSTTNQVDLSTGTAIFVPAPNPGVTQTLFTYGSGVTVGPSVQIPYSVRAVDSNGRPVYGAPVSFTSSPTGTLTEGASTTNVDGYAWVLVTSPTTSGDFVVTATVGTQTASLTSTVSGESGGGNGGGSGEVAKLIKVSGDGQLVVYGFAVGPQPLVVKALDVDGKPVVGADIAWSGTPDLFFPSSTTKTDADGIAQADFVANGDLPLFAGYLSHTATATWAGVSSTSFAITAFPVQLEKQPQIDVSKPETRQITAKLGTRLDGAVHVRVTSSTSVAIPKVGLRVFTDFTDTTKGPVAHCDGQTALNGTVLTSDSGEVDCNLVVEGRPGTSSLTISVGDRTQFGGYTLTVLAGDPVAPVIVQGNNQTGKPGATLPLALTARIVDSSGNILSGTAVTWTVVTANSLTLINQVSTADTNGLVSTRVVLGPNTGTFKVRLTAGGKSTDYTMTVETLATGFTKVSGDNQTGIPINTAFPQPLVVKVTNAQGAAVQGATVTWTTAGSVTLSATTSVTGADGLASVTATAGSVVGDITVTAAVTNLPSLTFTLKSRLPGPGITTASFSNFASGQTGVAPGLLVQITGAGLASGISGQVNANILAGKLPLTIAGVTVEFRWTGGSSYAPILRVANENGVESVLVQAPFEITGTTVNAIVNVSGGSTTVNSIPVSVLSPGVLEDVSGTRRAAVVIRSDGAAVTPSTPARPGETLRMYAIGLGQTTPTAETNHVGIPGQKVAGSIAVGLDNAGIEVVSAEMAENLIGVYEITFVVPAVMAPGDHPLGFFIRDAGGNPVYANGSVLAVGQP
ncbi:Ig-like domain-containing protein [uncultured Paludibaculum sp.]|uniref:Ig-like domain-containing protein n=1 Tax=uncultured Paludibaculum sp. TaxID=1765020 RepID=UPI002AABFCB3|nr:Ig-like domain-containing protein [uncultured Paludibaculum sp.]